MAATGLMQDDGSGFMQIAPSHDPIDSANRMVEFAKGVLAHSRTVKMPLSDQAVTVGALRIILHLVLSSHSKAFESLEYSPT